VEDIQLTDGPTLTKQLCAELWEGVLAHLNEGAALVNNEHFEMALQDEFTRITGREPTPDTCKRISRMVVEVNNKYPDTYLVIGVQNSIKQAFVENVRRLNWDMAQIQAKGSSSLRRFSHQESVRELLEESQLHLNQLELSDCIVDLVEEIQKERSRGADAPGEKHATAPASKVGSNASVKAIESAKAMEVEVDTVVHSSPEAQEAVAAGEVDQEEANRRSRQQERKRSQLVEREESRLPKNLASFIKQGLLTQDEAENVEALREVDERQKKGEIDEAEAEKIRNSILAGSAREELERKVREAIDHSIIYLQVYQAMQRIGEACDPALRFLIRHRGLVTAERFSGPEALEPLKALMDDAPLLEALIDLMERKDQEIRMLSVRLPPYNAIAGRGLERIGNMVIEEEFLDALRELGEEEISERLNSPNKIERVRPAADMRCLISLVDHLTKRTPFRKEVRMLRINHTLEELFRNNTDLKQARHQAESFLNRRLRRLFPDMSSDESHEIKMRGAEMIDAIEQRILTERQEVVKGKRQQVEEQAKESKSKGAGAKDELELSEEERKRGVQIGRVEMRIGGSMRRIPLKIMPDEEEPERYVIAQRDPDTGDIVAQMKRGQKRWIERGRDGSWKESKG